MTGDGKQEYVFGAGLRWYLLGAAAALVVVAALAVSGFFAFNRSLDRYVWPALVVAALFAWITARNLLLSATLDGGRLRARTLLARREIDITDITSLDWSVSENRLGSLNPLNQITARIRAGRRTLRVPMPAGAGLVRDLEAARSGGGHVPAHDVDDPDGGRVREFDFTSWAETGWAMRDTVIQYATLDDRYLRATTVDGRDHALRLADIDEVDHDQRRDGGEVLVRHNGEALRIPMPSGAELADRLSAAVPRR